MRLQMERLSGSMSQFFFSFLKLLEYPKSVMKCCGGNPDVITLDGIVMSIDSKRIQEAKLTRPFIFETNFNRQSTRKDRSILDLSKIEREIIDLYTSEEGVSVEDFNASFNLNRHPIIYFMKKTAEIRTGKFYSSELLKPFFRSCKKDICSAISLLPAMLWDSLDQFLEGTFDYFTLVILRF